MSQYLKSCSIIVAATHRSLCKAVGRQPFPIANLQSQPCPVPRAHQRIMLQQMRQAWRLPDRPLKDALLSSMYSKWQNFVTPA